MWIDDGSLSVPTYERIYAVSPNSTGNEATYGQIASLRGSLHPRMVGYAWLPSPFATEQVPWQRGDSMAQGKNQLRAATAPARLSKANSSQRKVFTSTPPAR